MSGLDSRPNSGGQQTAFTEDNLALAVAIDYGITVFDIVSIEADAAFHVVVAFQAFERVVTFPSEQTVIVIRTDNGIIAISGNINYSVLYIFLIFFNPRRFKYI